MKRCLVDTGPLVALFDLGDMHHEWAVGELRRVAAPVLTCEAVLVEALHLLRGLASSARALLAAWCEGWLHLDFDAHLHRNTISALMRKYHDVPMSLADACLVSMSDQHGDAAIMTLDSDFAVYRRPDRKPLPLIAPWQRP